MVMGHNSNVNISYYKFFHIISPLYNIFVTIPLLAYLYCHKNTLPTVQSGQSVGGSNNRLLIQSHSQEGGLLSQGAPGRCGAVLKALIHPHHWKVAL